MTEIRFYDILVENAKCDCSLKHRYTIDHKTEAVTMIFIKNNIYESLQKYHDAGIFDVLYFDE